MSAWELATLKAESWAPAGYLPQSAPRVAPEGYGAELLALDELVDVVAPITKLRIGEPVVFPAGVSMETGAVRPDTAKRSALGFRLGSELEVGDLLVPVSGDAPCILTNSAHSRLAFSKSFLALRSRDTAQAPKLWALLTSSGGAEARRQLSTGSGGMLLRANRLLELLVPPPGAVSESVIDELPGAPVEEAVTAPLLSTWRNVSLGGVSTWSPTRILDSVEETGGLPMAALGAVSEGRLDARCLRDTYFSGSVPAVTVGDLGHGEIPQRWSEPAGDSVAPVGSLLVGATTFRVAFYAQNVAVARQVLVIALRGRPPLSSDEVRDRLAGYLSTAAGQRRLRNIASGTAAPRLTRRALEEFRVPAPEALQPSKPAPANVPLARRLEKSLWS